MEVDASVARLCWVFDGVISLLLVTRSLAGYKPRFSVRLRRCISCVAPFYVCSAGISHAPEFHSYRAHMGAPLEFLPK